MAAHAMHPNQLADLVVACALAREASVALIEPALDSDEHGDITFERGDRKLASVRQPRALVEATAARLALLAGLPLGGDERIGRMLAMVRDRQAELIVALRTTPRGLSAEVRPLSWGERVFAGDRPRVLSRCAKCLRFYPAQAKACAEHGDTLRPVNDMARAGGTVGAYTLERTVGNGATGTVFLGAHAVIGRPVAIKLLHRALTQESELAARFLVEARAASRLHHPAIVDVTDYGLLEDGRPYIVMEQLAGTTLQDELKKRGPLPPSLAVKIARRIAEALDHAHAAGVVHHDLKPANVILLTESSEREPVLKLIDFGAARMGAAPSEEQEEVFGTPWYCSPEQARGMATDGRSDLYALGVVLYEMLTGKVPFPHRDPMKTLRAHLLDSVPPMETPAPLPAVLSELVMTLLAKLPRDRLPTGRDVVARLDECARALTKAKPR